MDLIRLESDSRDPLHGRRMTLLKLALSKRTGRHSDHLMKLERHMEVIDWENMTKDQFLIHLFAEGCSCNVMSKLAMEVLSSDNPTVADLRKKISETENSLWYSDNQKLSKYAGGNGMDGNPGGQNPPQGKYCKPIGNLSAMEFAVSVGREATVKIGAETNIRLLLQTQNRRNLEKK